jgi:hypothetical protein
MRPISGYNLGRERLKEQVKRKLDRFPTDFMFGLTKEEFHDLRSQIATDSGSVATKELDPQKPLAFRKALFF